MPAAPSFPLVIHATHEAGVKLGGIGAVLDGLLGADAYTARVGRSLVVGPMYGADSVFMDRLNAPGGVTVRYSSLHGIFDNVEPETRTALQLVESAYRVAVLYGIRRFGGVEHEVVLVDATNPAPEPVADFKFTVWRHYGIDSGRYEYDAEFRTQFAIAQPIFAALKALGVDAGLEAEQKIVVAHEWLGMPLVFAAQLNEPGRWRSVFYAHESAVARREVEQHDGHDTRFYNALDRGLAHHLYFDTLFGDQMEWFKAGILYQAIRCDRIFAVGDRVVDEMRFLGESFRHAPMDLVYNGIPANSPTPEQKQASKTRLQAYCRNLLGYTPDYVFTHVARMSLSKAFWRDLRVLDHLAPMLREEGKSFVLFVLATYLPAGRRAEWVRAWEAQYGWPVGHRADNGDLIDLEGQFFQDIQPFNWAHANGNVVLVNQFGWSRDRCGERMPEDMSFRDVRWGSDLEFGLSIYEPFGIAQLEPLAAGALCAVSSSCGCAGFVGRAAPEGESPNVVVVDYIDLPAEHPLRSPWDALAITRGTRDWIESMRSHTAARAIQERLPRTEAEAEALLESGHALAHAMSWEVVAADYFLPGLARLG